MNVKDLRLTGRKNHQENTVVKVKNVFFGLEKIVLIGGPCAVESEKQIEEIAKGINNVSVYRGGSFKPRTSPYSFLGLEKEGIQILKKISEEHKIPFVTEITKIEDLDYFIENVDIIQIGARDMQNFELLKAVGRTQKPVLLKRGFGNTVEELLLSSEYILKEGNPNVILCERGIRTFENSERFTLDIGAISIIKRYSHLPVIVDPSHASGDPFYIESLSLAAVASGADGLMVEIHNDPANALSDKDQALTIEQYNSLVEKIALVAKAIGRSV